jgi:EAL domain-containing protein (putative c-di-GMP-specific phosphodiesterase class I)
MTTPLDCLFLPKGTVLFSEGDVGDHAYLIQSGEIEIIVERDGHRLVLARRSVGEIIGEMALLDRGTRSASARVSEAAEVIAITKRQIEQRIAETDPILRMCLGVVIERYRDTLTMIRPDALPPPAPTRRGLPGPVFEAAVAVLTLERELERALLQDEFELYLQPIMRLRSRTLAGFEALIRWNHPVRGHIPPSQFIPVAESSGLVVQITDFMLRAAARAVVTLIRSAPPSAAGAEPLFVSINVSGHDLLQPGFADGVMQILAEADLPPQHFKLEITESMLMKDPVRAGSILDTCRRHGMGIAVDDFGTGYSSLSHLSTLPITTLKIDRCFVQAMVDDPTSRKIVNTIRLLARELAIPVVAEGIETETEAAALDAIGCEYGQGYLFGRPMPLAEAVLFLRAMLPALPRRACA